MDVGFGDDEENGPRVFSMGLDSIKVGEGCCGWWGWLMGQVLLRTWPNQVWVGMVPNIFIRTHPMVIGSSPLRAIGGYALSLTLGLVRLVKVLTSWPEHPWL